jgi:hypothetical protein
MLGPRAQAPRQTGGAVGKEIARIVDLPAGTRPFRPMIDFLHDGAEEVNEVTKQMQARLMERLGIADLLRPIRDPVDDPGS